MKNILILILLTVAGYNLSAQCNITEGDNYVTFDFPNSPSACYLGGCFEMQPYSTAVVITAANGTTYQLKPADFCFEDVDAMMVYIDEVMNKLCAVDVNPESLPPVLEQDSSGLCELIESKSGPIDSTIITDANGVDSLIVYTFPNGKTTVSGPAETLTTLVDNGDGSFSYTNEEGVTVTYGQPIELTQEISGDSIITTVIGELGTTDQSYVTITNETVTDVIDNVQYFITTTTDENGNEIIDTTGCKALPPNYLSSLVNDTYIIETGCDTSFLDIFANDTECFDPITGEAGPRSYTVILSSLTYEGCFLDIDLDGAGADVVLSDCQSAPNTCTFDYTDGKDTATVTILTVPDPVGVIRLTKSNNAPNNEVEAGDVFDYTYVICNDPNATGPITDISFVDIIDLSCFGNVTVDDAVDQNSNIVGGTGYDNVSGEMNFDWAGPLNVGECVSFDANVTVVKASGFEFIPNIAYVEGNDGVNGPGSTTDSAIDVLNEKEYSEARHQWSEPDASGNVTVTQEYVKQPSGALIPCGEPFIYEHYRDGQIWETIAGTLCGTDYTSDRTDGLSVLDFSPVGDFGNGLTFGFNLNDFNNAVNSNNNTECNCCPIVSTSTLTRWSADGVNGYKISVISPNANEYLTTWTHPNGSYVVVKILSDRAYNLTNGLPFINGYNTGFQIELVESDFSGYGCNELDYAAIKLHDIDKIASAGPVTPNTWDFFGNLTLTPQISPLGADSYDVLADNQHVYFEIFPNAGLVEGVRTGADYPEDLSRFFVEVRTNETICADPIESKIYVGGDNCPLSENKDNDASSGGCN